MRQFLICFISLLVACVSDNPGAELKATQKTFVATVRSLTYLKKANKLSKQDIKKIDHLIGQINHRLKAWEKDYAIKTTEQKKIDLVKKLLTDLISLETEARQ